MKSFLFIFFLLLTSTTQASCFEYELLGLGEMSEKNIFFVIAQGTQSEVKLAIPFNEQDKLIPYIDRFAKTRLIIDRNQLNFSTKVLQIISIDYQTPDPLNLSSKSSVRRMGEVKCPKK